MLTFRFLAKRFKKVPSQSSFDLSGYLLKGNGLGMVNRNTVNQSINVIPMTGHWDLCQKALAPGYFSYAGCNWEVVTGHQWVF